MNIDFYVKWTINGIVAIFKIKIHSHVIGTNVKFSTKNYNDWNTKFLTFIMK